MRYSYKRAYSWSDSISYAIGLLASDGCLSSDGRHIDLTSMDTEQLENFILAIGRDLKITEKKNRVGETAYRVQFGDVTLYDFLLSVGLTPRKSLTISNLNIPNDYYRHFLRGIFDGDGSVYGYDDPRWPTSLVFYIVFSSASRDFVSYLREMNSRLAEVSCGSIRTSKNLFTLAYGKKDSYMLYEFMYQGIGERLFLKRKRDKILSFFERDENAKIARQTRAGGVTR